MHGSIQNECWHGNNFGLRYRSKQTQHVSSCSKCSIFIYLLCVREQRKINVRVFILYVSWGKKRRDLFFFLFSCFQFSKTKSQLAACLLFLNVTRFSRLNYVNYVMRDLLRHIFHFGCRNCDVTTKYGRLRCQQSTMMKESFYGLSLKCNRILCEIDCEQASEK